jgi:hypothetical protein
LAPLALNFDEDVSVPVAVDHGQFLIQDPATSLDIEAYSERATRAGLAV